MGGGTGALDKHGGLITLKVVRSERLQEWRSGKSHMSQLALGLYLNLFPVEVPVDPVRVMVVARSRYPDLRPLRSDFERLGQTVWVYPDGDKIYGYGRGSATLTSKGFRETEIRLHETPRLAGRMVLEGFLEQIKQEGYTPDWVRKRCRAFNWDSFQTTRDLQVRVYRGYELRSLFLFDAIANEMVFGLVIDATYAFRDQSGGALSPHDIRQRFDGQTFREVRQIQRDLIPTGINTEVARQRLLEDILPFVSRFPTFLLPCDVRVNLSPEPIRIVLGRKADESVW